MEDATLLVFQEYERERVHLLNFVVIMPGKYKLFFLLWKRRNIARRRGRIGDTTIHPSLVFNDLFGAW